MRIGSARVRVRSDRTCILSFSTPGSCIWGPCCVEDERRCSDGGRSDDRFAHGALLFIDDEASKERTMTSSTWVATFAFDWFGSHSPGPLRLGYQRQPKSNRANSSILRGVIRTSC